MSDEPKPCARKDCGHRRDPNNKRDPQNIMPTRGHFRGVGECYECPCPAYVAPKEGSP